MKKVILHICLIKDSILSALISVCRLLWFFYRWSAMAQVMGNRTDNDIKNKWNSMKRSATKAKKKAARPAAQTISKSESLLSESSSFSSSEASSDQEPSQPKLQVLHEGQSYPHYSFDGASMKQKGGVPPTVSHGATQEV